MFRIRGNRWSDLRASSSGHIPTGSAFECTSCRQSGHQFCGSGHTACVRCGVRQKEYSSSAAIVHSGMGRHTGTVQHPSEPSSAADRAGTLTAPTRSRWRLRRARVSLTRSAAGPAALQAEPVAPWLAPMARSTDTVTDWLLCAGSGTSSMICCESR